MPGPAEYMPQASVWDFLAIVACCGFLDVVGGAGTVLGVYMCGN